MAKKVTGFYKYFVSTCRKKFKFLEKEFLLRYDESIIGSGVSVIYKNDNVAVCITLSEEYGGILIDLIQLKNKEIPIPPVEINQATELNEFDFGDLLHIRSPELKIERPPIDDLVFNRGREIVIERVLKQYAKALRLYAVDILKGDFSVFPQLEKIVKERAEKFRKQQ